MNWPNHTDYQDSIQNPAQSFMEEELKASEVANDMLGMPKVMSGNFASVYEITSAAGKRYAIRCFVRQVSNQQVRYNLLTRHLQSISLEHLVGFEFILRGIRVRNEWYPIVKMDWVVGTPMHVYVEEHVGEPETMLRLAEQWQEMVKGLRDNQIAHGDLQHGNVMCMPDGKFRLVDYDGMYVPSFGQGRSPELGHANFQHPRRTPDYYDGNLDNFAALVGYTSFLALAREPALWQDFHTGDNLIFLSNDFKDPRQSKVFQRLRKNPDDRVQKLAAVLERACIWPIAQVPSFEVTMAALASGTLPEPTPLQAVSNAAPEWLTATTEYEGPRGTRISPTPSDGTAPVPKPATRPAPRDHSSTVTEGKSDPLHLSTGANAGARLPVSLPDEPPAFNLFAWVAVGLALLCFIPKLNLFGLTAIICGLFGWFRAPNHAKDISRWAALGGMILGGALFMMGLLKVLK
jgi:hypothetical protein